MIVIFPNTWVANKDAALVKAGETRQIPEVGEDKFKITVGKPLGTAEVLIIASAAPLRDALKRLQQIADSRGQRGGALPLDEEATAAVDDLLGDLDRGTRGNRSLDVSFDPTTRAVDTSQLAALSITFRSVEA
jgi:hypothetical protein